MKKNTVTISILYNSEKLFERFESAFDSIAETYIKCTPIDISNIEVKNSKDKILVEFDYNSLELEYEYEFEEGAVKEKASLPNGDIVDSFMEFWIKWAVEGFFNKELKVETEHTAITFNVVEGKKTM
ncbi:hypothetical protein CR203_19490 [Salipaludibacillus neizhouensis]|uniref:Uncharacterized protein n=1 Tax=Salipaludibacillus neizhouensis TaxID=885475 RepID=A0A3A9KDW1_9BACI|nr:hypothetical protein [Salipaludibacillus neizhouensis]RKL65665.1 hypothetical protein CR203_19490 [Salipaludibacillus neizhouensis]